ncbi:DUF2298 domain-containing protein [Halomarina oriensis]|uniref:DUF2298 domain-containing protein n=1 Tax=Halomarina oriensis TaxID=671145 RepID=A0A6B0GH84_9EURY|nr:DUF2298 domain-containing protein [Halomarina oriensis]MWG33317.1 hypothetical protein [Halomarina oriensis]
MEIGLVLLWLVAYLALFAAGLPVVAALCPPLADRGAGVALTLSLFVLGFVTWVVGQVAFGWPTILLALAVLLGASVLALRSGARPDPRVAVETALVFALAFLFLVAVRAVDPAVHATMGEKFLDFSMLKALLRADRLPPLDPWFAGERVQYYYGGHLVAAIVTKLTFTAPRYAYNLALAGFYAMLVTAAYGLAGALGDRLGGSRTTAAAFGAFFVGVASNLEVPVKILLGLLPQSVLAAGAGVAGVSLEEWEGTLTAPFSEFTYWSASRVIPGTINEFPLFAFLNGDLHAHMMSTPFMLLGVTLAYSYFRTFERHVWRRRGLLVLVALVTAFLAVVNTWSFPTLLGVAWLAVAFAPADPLTLFSTRFGGNEPSPLSRGTLDRTRRAFPSWSRTESRWTGGALLVTAVLALVAVAASLTFWGGATSGRSIELVQERSALWGLLVVHGAYLLIFVPFLFSRARETVALSSGTVAAILGGWLVTSLVAWALGFAAFGLFVPLLLGAWLVLRGRRADAHDPSFATVLLVAATGVVLLVELVFVSEEAGPNRYNTVFKTYMQVWVLWAPAAGAALSALVARATPAPSLAEFASADRAMFERVRPATVLAVLVLASTALYGGFAMSDHFGAEPGRYDYGAAEWYVPEDPTLDATQFVETYHADEAAAIGWLDDEPGQVTIAAAPGWQAYQWTNPESSLTGHMSVAGWRHEIGYRGAETYTARASDADAMFEASPQERARLLAEYEVDYVYVGPREREAYGEDVSFERVPGVTVERRFDAVTLYSVDRSQLSAASENASGS